MRREDKGGWGVAVIVVAIALLLPVLYVLSLGPAVRLVNGGFLSESAAEAFYTPLIFVAENCAPAGYVLDAYENLWEPTTSAPPLPPPTAAPLSQPAPMAAPAAS
jgi:hypothetical protein